MEAARSRELCSHEHPCHSRHPLLLRRTPTPLSTYATSPPTPRHHPHHVTSAPALIASLHRAAGTAVYNEAIKLPCLSYPTAAERAEAREKRSAQGSRTQALLGDHSGPPSVTPSPPLGPQVLPLQSVGKDGAPLAASPKELRVKDFFTPTLSRFTMNKS